MTRQGYETVYVVPAGSPDNDPAAFASLEDAERYALVVGSEPVELLVCDGETAAKMIADAERDE